MGLPGFFYALVILIILLRRLVNFELSPFNFLITVLF